MVFLNFLSCLKKYQNLDLATIWSVAKILILRTQGLTRHVQIKLKIDDLWQRREFHLYKGVTGSDSVGIFLPITLYSFRVPLAFILPSER